ncbi:MAG: hypothetical protein R3C53_20405 [Pirellulaceae bacterium]
MRTKFPAIVVILCLNLVTAKSLVGQEAPQISGVQILGINASGEGGQVASGKLIEGVAGVFSSGGGSFFQSSPLGVDPNSGSQLFKLMANESVQKELKLTDEQRVGTMKIMDESRKRMSEFLKKRLSERSANGSASFSLDGNAMREVMAQSQAEAEAAIEEILLPEQFERIKQLAFQIEVAQIGLGESLTNGRLGTEIDVHDDQKQHLTDRAMAIEAEARAAIAQIRSAAQAKLLAELTPDQRKAAEERLGKYFAYEEPSFALQMRKQLQAAQAKAAPPQED